MATITIETAIALLEEMIKENVATMLWGPPGIGKTSICRQLAAKLKMGCKTFNAVTHNPVDLMGLPVPNMKAKTTDWLRPCDLPDPKRDGETGILLLDDLVNASQSMQAACFQLVLERRVGDHELAPGWIPIGAGNRMADRSGVQRMPTALKNRFAHFDIEPDANAVCKYWSSIGINPFFVAFHRFRKELIHVMPKSEENAFPSPRSWEDAAKFLDRPKEIRMQLVASKVGDGPAAELEAFLRVCNSVPTFDSIIADPDGAVAPTDPACRYAVTGLLARESNRKNFATILRYATRLGREFEMVTVVDAVKRQPDLQQTAAYAKFAVDNTDLTL